VAAPIRSNVWHLPLRNFSHDTCECHIGSCGGGTNRTSESSRNDTARLAMALPRFWIWQSQQKQPHLEFSNSLNARAHPSQDCPPSRRSPRFYGAPHRDPLWKSLSSVLTRIFAPAYDAHSSHTVPTGLPGPSPPFPRCVSPQHLLSRSYLHHWLSFFPSLLPLCPSLTSHSAFSTETRHTEGDGTSPRCYKT